MASKVGRFAHPRPLKTHDESKFAKTKSTVPAWDLALDAADSIRFSIGVGAELGTLGKVLVAIANVVSFRGPNAEGLIPFVDASSGPEDFVTCLVVKTRSRSVFAFPGDAMPSYAPSH